MENNPQQASDERKSSVSILVLAFNEAESIVNALSTINGALEKQKVADFEFVLVDAGSSDGTGKIMDECAARDTRISVIHFASRGLGHSFREGVSHASKEYVGWFPGDDETLPETMTNVFRQLGKADVIIPYTVNPWVRPLGRRILSVIYTKVFNGIFGVNLKYFNGPCFFRRSLLSTVTMSADGPAYMAEILVQMVRNKKASFVEVPMYLKAQDGRKSRILRWKNVYEIAKTMADLFVRTRLTRRG